jgi:predicted Zn-dependent protease
MNPSLRVLLAVLMSVSFAGAHADAVTADLPSIGDSAGQIVSPEQERQLGAAFMRQLRQQAVVVEDPELNSYIQTLGHRLVAKSDLRPFDYTFFLVKDPAINAFAAPGGYIGVNTGLFLNAQSESELAGVLAHEIAHVVQRHMARTFEAADKLSIPAAAAMLAAILIGTQNSEAGQAALAAVQAGSLQYQINFTRANEKEADRVGINILEDAGYNPLGMPRFFQRLHENARLYGGSPPEFLSTHPVTENRIAESTARAEQFGTSGVTDSLTFQLMKAKLRIAGVQDAATYLTDYARNKKNLSLKPPVEEYELALALEAAGRNDYARKRLQDLHRADPDRITYRLALAQLQLTSHRTDEALKLYADTLKLYPGDATVTREYADALIKAGQPAEARDVLEPLVRSEDHPQPGIYLLLAQAASESGHAWEAHSAMAEYYYLNGQTHDAIEQLTLALEKSDLTFYDSARLEARREELKKEAQAAGE